MGTAWPIRSSFAPVWGHCSGAIMASESCPNIETDASRNGQAAHWVVSETLEHIKQTGQVVDCDRWVGEIAPNGVVIDDDMVHGAQVMVDDVLEVAGERMQDLLIEHGVHMPRIHEQNGGTLDAAIFIPERKVIFVWDYKNGHRECLAKENLQIIDYGEGLAYEFGIDGLQDQEITVVFRIVQPFCYRNGGPIDEWVCKLSDLRPYFNQLHAKAHEAFTNPRLSAGKHCRDCPAVGTCTGARQYAYAFIDYINQPYQMDEMAGRDLAVEQDILATGLSVIKSRLEAIDDSLKHCIAMGDASTGMTLQGAYGNLEWTVPEATAIALASQFGHDIAKTGIKTPTQARDSAPKAIKQQFVQVMKSITKRPPKGLTLVKAEDSLAARAFSKQ